MAECIYCRAATNHPQFSRPDHVIPKSFGRFKNNFTIFCVCEVCNQWFGDNLEKSFGRNSGEAILRLLFGVKAPTEATEVGGERLEITLDDDDELRGAKVYFTATEDGQLVTAAPLQVGFRVPGTTRTNWFLENELTKESVQPFEGCQNYTIGGSGADYARVELRLAELGRSRQETMWLHPDESKILKQTLVRVDYQLDVEVFRAVAKIGFNYMAHQASTEFCLLPEFDPFRRFVRYGEGEQDDFIRLGTDALLFEERRFGGKQTRGHLVTVEWHPRKEAPTGSVKLFNDLHYKLRFANRMYALWRELRAGHHFDIADMTIDRLSVVWWRPIGAG
jgi:HNH endonuclease